MTHYPSQLRKIEAHIRRRIRARLIEQQKRRRYLFPEAGETHCAAPISSKDRVFKQWSLALSHSRAAEWAYPNQWFIKELGLKIRSDEKHSHWFGLNQWIKVT